MATKNALKFPVKGDKYASTVIGNSDMTVEDIPLTDNVVLIMGPTGSGKSTFINYICGGNGEGIGHHLESCTDKITITRVQFNKVPEPVPTRSANIYNGRTDQLDTPGLARIDKRSQTPDVEPLASTGVDQSNNPSVEHQSDTPSTGGQYDRAGRSLGVPTAGAASASSVENSKYNTVDQYGNSSAQRSEPLTERPDETYSNRPRGLATGKSGGPTGYQPEAIDVHGSSNFVGTTHSVQQSNGFVEDDQSSTFGPDRSKPSEGDRSALAKMMSRLTPFGRRSPSTDKRASKFLSTDHPNISAANNSSISIQPDDPLPNPSHSLDGQDGKEFPLIGSGAPETPFQGLPATYHDTIQSNPMETRRTELDHANWTKANGGAATRGAGNGANAARQPGHNTLDIKRSNTATSTQSRTLVDDIHDYQPYPSTTDFSATSSFGGYNGGEPQYIPPGGKQSDLRFTSTAPNHYVPSNPRHSEAGQVENPLSFSPHNQPVTGRQGTNSSLTQPSPYPAPDERLNIPTVAQVPPSITSQRSGPPGGRPNNDPIVNSYNRALIERSNVPGAVSKHPFVVDQEPRLPITQLSSGTVGKPYDHGTNQSNYTSHNNANDNGESKNDEAIEDGSTTCFIDTPGFDDTYKSDIEILTMIAEFLVIAHGRKLKLDTILYLHRISDNRMAGSPLKNLQLFASLCGNVAMPNVVLVTTMWSLVPEDVGEQRLVELRKDFWSPMLEKGCTVAPFKDSYESAFAVTFPDEERLKAILLSKQLVQKRKQLKATEVGYTMNTQLKKLEKDKRDASKRLKNVAKRQKNPAVKEALESEMQTLDNTISEVSSRARSFDLSFGSNIMRRFSKQQAPIIPTIGK
ncbi:hypothetical protein FRC17_007003 [Serendipita sp. 399]|nr:hypothetical protein FRC17_007003 [Serendipita sp. 399]